MLHLHLCSEGGVRNSMTGGESECDKNHSIVQCGTIRANVKGTIKIVLD